MTGNMRVAELWTYPVQSLQGERRQELTATSKGITFDRYFAIADVEMGSIAHASRPNWKGLIKWQARWLVEPDRDRAKAKVEIQFDDGVALTSDDTRLDGEISRRLGRKLRFVRNDGGEFKPLYQSAACHFITSASLAEFRRHYPEGDFAPARFRPNVVIDCDNRLGFVEQSWIGRELAIDGVRLKVTEDCARCALTTRAQGELPMDARILHTVQQANRTLAGAYADFISDGRIREGSEVALVE